MPDNVQPTQPLSPGEAALVRLAGDVFEMKGKMGTFTAALAEHSAKSAAAQAALLAEINKVKLENATACQLHTGDQRAAVEKLQMERRMVDHETRSKLEAYEKERTDIIHRLDRVCGRLEKGDRKIARGEMAFNILKWAGLIIGGLLLAAAVTKLFLAGETIRIGASYPTALAGAISYGVAQIWSAWLVVTGIVLAAIDFKHRHLG